MKSTGFARDAIFAIKQELKDSLPASIRGRFRIAIDGNSMSIKESGGDERWVVRAFNAGEISQPDSTMVVDRETGGEIQIGGFDSNARIAFGKSGEGSEISLLCGKNGVLWKKRCSTMEEAVDSVTMHVAREMAESQGCAAPI